MHPERSNGLYVVPERLFIEYGALNPHDIESPLTDDDGLLTNCVMPVIEKPPGCRQLHWEEISAFCCAGDVTPLECLHHPIQIVNRYQDAHIECLPFNLICIWVDISMFSLDAVTQVKVFGQLRGNVPLNKIVRQPTVNWQFIMPR